MSRVSGSFAWGIRWETVDRLGGRPLFGEILSGTFETLREARQEQRQLALHLPVQGGPFDGIDRPVRYVVFAHRPGDVDDL